MTRRARWIRLTLADGFDLRGICEALALVQVRGAAPIVLWARAGSREGGCGVAVIAPTHAAPGLAARRVAWALSPVVAAFRDFGIRAYLDGSDVRVQGHAIGSGSAARAGDCVAVAARFERVAFVAQPPRRMPQLHAWLREALGLTSGAWGGAGLPAEREFEAALRARSEAQHGWQFENSWPSALERAKLRGAQGACRLLTHQYE